VCISKGELKLEIVIVREFVEQKLRFWGGCSWWRDLVQNAGLDSSSSCCTSVTWKMTSNGEMGEMGANWTGNTLGEKQSSRCVWRWRCSRGNCRKWGG
jgi:hypothetical protein